MGKSAYRQTGKSSALERFQRTVNAVIFSANLRDAAAEDDSDPHVGSLLQFVDGSRLGGLQEALEVIPSTETLTARNVAEEQQEDLQPIGLPQAGTNAAGSPPAPPAPPPPVPAVASPRGARRGVAHEVAGRLSARRAQFPRRRQSREPLPQLGGDASASAARMTSAQGLPTPRSPGSPAPAVRPLQSRPTTNFTHAFAESFSSKVKANPDKHPLLVAMAEGDADGAARPEAKGLEHAHLAHRLDGLRSSRGWHVEQSDPPPARALASPLAHQGPLDALPPGDFQGGAAPAAAHSGRTGGLPRWGLVPQLVDPEGTGRVPHDVLVPLMYWLGLARRRASALLALETAFGAGEIEVGTLLSLNQYVEVQLALVEGLRSLARKESLERLCEFMMDSDRLRIRSWLSSMRRESDGRADIAHILDLFTHMGIAADRQAVFRFLSSFKNQGRRSGVAGAPEGQRRGALPSQRSFSAEDLGALLCRCLVTWCLARTLSLVAPSDRSRAGERDVALAWSQLQRKILVSLLVNERFWGAHSKQVLAHLRPAARSLAVEGLSGEQWRSLFQRVQAQGMASLLPRDEEADDPGYLRRKAEHDDLAPRVPLSAR